MKASIENHLLTRINNAAENGSVVAKAIIEELDKDVDEIFDGKSNYFSSLRLVSTITESSDDRSGDVEYEFHTIRIMITYCNKDLNNEYFPDKDNPKAPYFEHNRNRVSPSGFVDMFVNLRGKFSSEEIEYFDSAIRLNSVVRYRIGETMEDFHHAYHYSNYYNTAQDSCSTLHKSCMRHNDVANICSDFYVNFAGAKILIAETPSGEILGRAILWDDVELLQDGYSYNANLVDRVYSTYKFLDRAILDKAAEFGYVFSKTRNEAKAINDFTIIRELKDENGDVILSVGKQFEHGEVYYRTNSSLKCYRNGVPYLDTMFTIAYDNGFYLTNAGTVNEVAIARNPGGFADIRNHVCPLCGEIHNYYTSRFGHICEDCERESVGVDRIGLPFYKIHTAVFKGMSYPVTCLKFEENTPVDFSEDYYAAITVNKFG